MVVHPAVPPIALVVIVPRKKKPRMRVLPMTYDPLDERVVVPVLEFSIPV